MTAACAILPIKESEKLFFSESPTKQAKAKEFCKSCTFTATCLQMALDNNIEYGIFGGLTARERQLFLENIGEAFVDI